MFQNEKRHVPKHEQRIQQKNSKRKNVWIQWQNIFNSKTVDSNLTGLKCVFGFEYFTKFIEMYIILAFGNFLKHYLSWNIYKSDDNCFNKSESSTLFKSISARRNIVQFIKTQFMPFIFISLVIQWKASWTSKCHYLLVIVRIQLGFCLLCFIPFRFVSFYFYFVLCLLFSIEFDYAIGYGRVDLERFGTQSCFVQTSRGATTNPACVCVCDVLFAMHPISICHK